MKVSCEVPVLAEALSTVARALSTRATLPILRAVLLEAAGDGLRLGATDLELGIRCQVSADVLEEGVAAVPGRLLADFVAALDDDRVELVSEPATRELLMRSPSFTTEMRGLPPDEFPPGPADLIGPRLEVDSGTFLDAIADVAFSASADEMRPVLTGVLMQAAPGRLALTATDGYRLGERAMEPLTADAELQVIVPARALAEVARVFRDARGSLAVVVSAQGNQASFHGPGAEVSSRLIDGTYPGYRRAIPESWSTRVTISAPELRRRLRALALFASDDAHVVRLCALADRLELSATTSEVGSARTAMPASSEGAEAELALNVRYLLDGLGRVEDDVELLLGGPLAPAVLRRAGSQAYRYVVMPARYRS